MRVIVDEDDDERAHSRRYTEDGINVVALDRRSRGLHRARPVRRFPTYRSVARPEEPRRWVPTLVFVALVLAVLALVLVRAS